MAHPARAGAALRRDRLGDRRGGDVPPRRAARRRWLRSALLSLFRGNRTAPPTLRAGLAVPACPRGKGAPYRRSRDGTARRQDRWPAAPGLLVRIPAPLLDHCPWSQRGDRQWRGGPRRRRPQPPCQRVAPETGPSAGALCRGLLAPCPAPADIGLAAAGAAWGGYLYSIRSRRAPFRFRRKKSRQPCNSANRPRVRNSARSQPTRRDSRNTSAG